MEMKFKASFNLDLDLQSFIFGDMNDKDILVHVYMQKNISVSFLFFVQYIWKYGHSCNEKKLKRSG